MRYTYLFDAKRIAQRYVYSFFAVSNALVTLNCLVSSIVIAVCLFSLLYNTPISDLKYCNLILLVLVLGWCIIFVIMRSKREAKD